MENITVIIPSLNPDEKLKQVVDSLLEAGIRDIVLVNDGSDEAHMEPFYTLGKYPQCTILTHKENKGKGRALKDAFLYVWENRKNIAGVVTVDGDNQHTTKDILNCAAQMISLKNNVVLGVRDFSGDDVPFKSRFGNELTSFIFKFACGLSIKDTQTGLRAIPYEYLKEFSEIKGERFEYETNMLLELKVKTIPFTQEKIDTVYINENETTHFNPIKDSFRIYKIIFGFIFSSMIASVIDLGMFTLLSVIMGDMFALRPKIFIATMGARFISSLVNYSVNRKAVFKSKGSVRNTMIRYYILCVGQMLVSFGMVYIASALISAGNALTSVIKAVVDTFLFFLSFRIQRAWVFKKD